MKKLSVSLIILTIGLFSCGSEPDFGLDHDFKGTWKLYQTCVNGCIDTDPDITVTIEFSKTTITEKQDDQVIGGATYELSQAQDDGNNTTIYLIIVNSKTWQLGVTENTLDITAGGIFRRYTKVE